MLRGLDLPDLDPDPVAQFAKWFHDAHACPAIREANAMVLSTVSADGNPHGRFVLLKGFGPEGFILFTSHDSDKGHDLAAHPHAALTLGWIELERQVRIEGTVTRTPREKVEAYFQTRPRGSRLGAWASEQSRVIADRGVLERQLEELSLRFPDDVPAPPNWGGYCVAPEQIEFWQGRTNRLHDRLRYRRNSNGWTIERLSP